MLKRENILVISTGVLKQWVAWPRKIKLSCWKCCEVDHYLTAPPVVFLKVFQFIYGVAKQLFPTRCRTLVSGWLLQVMPQVNKYLWYTVLASGFSRQLVKAQNAAAGVFDCPAGRIGRFWKQDKSWFSHSYRAASWYYQCFIYSPTDALVNCLKN
jgi:hypothetical protein